MRCVRPLIGTLLVLGGFAAACSPTTEPANVPANIAPVDGDHQEAVTPSGWQFWLIGSAWLPDSLRVRVTNAAGAPVAGVPVGWSSTGGTVFPSSPATDAAGVATARWSWASDRMGWAPVGAHTARAAVPNVGSVTFTGYARAGVVVKEFSLTPETVNVASGPAQVTVAVRATDDRRDVALTFGVVAFYKPTVTRTGNQFLHTELALASGSAADGVWKGTITVPQGAEAGAWPLSYLNLGWGCGGAKRIELSDEHLKALGLPHQLHVTAASSPASFVAPGGGTPRRSTPTVPVAASAVAC